MGLIGRLDRDGLASVNPIKRNMFVFIWSEIISHSVIGATIERPFLDTPV